MELQALLLTKEQIAKVGDRFKLHKSKAYGQVLHLSLNGYRAFVGRDFKLVCQQYALMFHLAYNDPLNISVFPDDDDNLKRFDLIFDCFDKLSNSASLVYMKKVEKNVEQYKEDVHGASREFIDSFNVLCHTPLAASGAKSKKTSFTLKKGSKLNRLKTHSVSHFVENIEHLCTMIHLSSERGEQHNSKIRNAAHHSNHHDLSYDIARYFAVEMMHRGLAQNCVRNDGAYTVGLGVIEAVNTDFYMRHINQTSTPAAEVVVGTTVMFEDGSHAYIGECTHYSLKDKSVTFDIYEFELNDDLDEEHANNVNILESVKKHPSGNPLLSLSGSVNTDIDTINSSSFVKLDSVDICEKYSEGTTEYRILNKCKFGALFLLKNLNY
jgi:hypothetical protein